MQRLTLGLVLLSVCLTAVFAPGATIDNWLPSSSTPISWNNGANWSTNNPPQGTEAAVFPNGSLPSGTTSVTLDGSQTIYGLRFNPGSGGYVVTLDPGTGGTLTLLSTDSAPDEATTFNALRDSVGSLHVNVPIQLGNGNSGSYTATIFSAVGDHEFTISSGISESPGQTWGVRIDGNGAGTVNFEGAPETYTGDTTITTTGVLRVISDNLLPNGAGKGNLVIEGSGQFIDDDATNTTINGLSSTSSTASIVKTGSNTRTLTIGAGDASATYAGNIPAEGGGTLAITKTGAGVQTLSGTYNYRGETQINGGTLLMDGTHVRTTTDSGNVYQIASGAALGGTGSISIGGASINVSGTIAPGPSLASGVLNIGAPINFNNGSNLEIQFAGNTPGDTSSNYDQLNMTSADQSVNLTGAVSLNLSLLNGFTPANSDIFYILSRADSAAWTNLFSGTNEGGLVSLGDGLIGRITYQANWTGTQGGSSLTGGNDIAIYDVTTPEPASLSLLCLGALSTLRRRRK